MLQFVMLYITSRPSREMWYIACSCIGCVVSLVAGVFLGARVHSRTQWYSCGTSDNRDQWHQYRWTGAWWDCVPTLNHRGRCKLVATHSSLALPAVWKWLARAACLFFDQLSLQFHILWPSNCAPLYGVTSRNVYKEYFNIQDWYYAKQLEGWEPQCQYQVLYILET